VLTGLTGRETEAELVDVREVLGNCHVEEAADGDSEDYSVRDDRLMPVGVKDRELLLKIRKAPDPKRHVIGLRVAPQLMRRIAMSKQPSLRRGSTLSDVATANGANNGSKGGERQSLSTDAQQQEEQRRQREVAMFSPLRRNKKKKKKKLSLELWSGRCVLHNEAAGLSLVVEATLSGCVVPGVVDEKQDIIEACSSSSSWGLDNEEQEYVEEEGQKPRLLAYLLLSAYSPASQGNKKKALLLEGVISKSHAKAFLQAAPLDDDDDSSGESSSSSSSSSKDAEEAASMIPAELRGLLPLVQRRRLARDLCEKMVVLPRGALRAQRIGGAFFFAASSTFCWGHAEFPDHNFPRVLLNVLANSGRILTAASEAARRPALLAVVGEINVAIVSSSEVLQPSTRAKLVAARDAMLDALKKQTLAGLKLASSKKHEVVSLEAACRAGLVSMLAIVAQRDVVEDKNEALREQEAREKAAAVFDEEDQFLKPRVVLGITKTKDHFVTAPSPPHSPRKSVSGESRASSMSKASRIINIAEALAREDTQLRERKLAARDVSNDLSEWRMKVNTESDANHRKDLERALNIETEHVHKRHQKLMQRPKAANAFKV
jgi:hypothetical protein